MTMPRVTRFVAAGFLLGLGACNLPSSALVKLAQDDGAPQQALRQLFPNVEVRYSPGLPLLAAAADAPLAFSRLRGAAARLDLDQLSFGEAGVILEGELLHKGMLLPLPAGMLTIRTIAPEAPIAAAPVVPVAAPVSAPELPRRQLPELIGAYSAGRRTLVLATDGSYLMYGPAEPHVNGTFYLIGDKLELKPQSGATLAFAPTGAESWNDGRGAVYTLIHELPIADGQHSRKARGGR